MGYSITPKGADVLEVLKVFERHVTEEETLPEVELEYEQIKEGHPIPEHLLPDVIFGMVSFDLVQYES